MPDIQRSVIVPYTAAQMYELVNAVEHYPQFVPWCKAVDVISRNPDEVRAELHFTRGGMSKSFSTINRLQKDKMIELRLLDGPFKHLEGFWRFESLPNAGCQVTLDMEFQFSNRLLSMAFEPFFVQVTNALVDAFKDRAEEVYAK